MLRRVCLTCLVFVLSGHPCQTANYIIRKESYDLGKFTMEGSRPAVSLFLHANLEIMGVKVRAVQAMRNLSSAQILLLLRSRRSSRTLHAVSSQWRS